jgi:hypothetical protein
MQTPTLTSPAAGAAALSAALLAVADGAAVLVVVLLEQPTAAEAIIIVAKTNATIFFIEKSPYFLLFVWQTFFYCASAQILIRLQLSIGYYNFCQERNPYEILCSSIEFLYYIAKPCVKCEYILVIFYNTHGKRNKNHLRHFHFI